VEAQKKKFDGNGEDVQKRRSFAGEPQRVERGFYREGPKSFPNRKVGKGGRRNGKWRDGHVPPGEKLGGEKGRGNH